MRTNIHKSISYYYIMSILTPSNKKMLVQLLGDHPLQKQNAQQFRHVLQQHLERIHHHRFDYNNNLMLMNKELIRTFSQIAAHIQTTPPATTSTAPLRSPPPTLFSQTPPIQKLTIGSLVDKSAIIDKRLKEHKSNFDELIQGKKPVEIDFRDKNVDPPIRQHDSIMTERQQELKKIMTTYQSSQQASKWISGDETKIAIDDKQILPIESDAIPLSSTPPTPTTPPSNEKRVTFQIDEPHESATFLKQLKRPNMEELLSTILQNQEKILALLQPKESILKHA